MWKISLFHMVELNPTFDWACLMPWHGMTWHRTRLSSVIICINKRQERQQQCNANSKQRHTRTHRNSCILSALTTWTAWFISSLVDCGAQKRVPHLVGPRKRHTISLFGVSIEFIIYFSFIFLLTLLSTDVFYFLLLKFCCVFIVHL